MSAFDFPGWDRLRHGGLLLDGPRLRRLAEHEPDELSSYHERELRRMASALIDGNSNAPDFVSFVLEKICGFTNANGTWQRGSQIGAEWSRRTITDQSVKPRQLWRGSHGGLLPVFFDDEARLGIGRGRKAASQTLQWLRAGNEKLALLTNGRQWRLIFAGLDFDAWCEWDVDLWFEEGALSPQVQALRTLISPNLWTPPAKDAQSALLEAIFDTRKGQAELSAVLGERVREAVELLVQSHGEVLKERCSDVDPADIYRAAVRVVMRMVVALFAESRELLPRYNALYHGTYGLTGLLEELEKVAARGGNRLARSWNAWPRVLALFRLVHQGSHHPELLVPAYGGELFAAGDPTSADGLTRALAVFETACFDREILPDREVHRLLERITRTKVKVRQGRASTWMPAPVDFSDLSSEYIGILYEGLLDFELKTAPSGDPVIFLAVGNQPALPLSRLEDMDDRALANLLEKMKDTSSAGEDEEAGEEGETPEATEEDVTDEEEGEEESVSDVTDEEESGTGDERHVTRTRAEEWARRAVKVGNLVTKPRGNLTPERRRQYEESVARKARQLVIRVILPGEWYLVRWGGTRKGSGTFYTRPGLAVPTVQRTLRPLAYAPPVDSDGKPNTDAPPVEWSPKRPEEILALKVCDPACGSGTFPVTALRFLTDAVYASLHHHGRIKPDGDRAIVSLLGKPKSTEEQLGQELLPCRPDDALFELRLKAILRRYVVERCIYGVDLDPLAVELCRLALWIETMDRELPFSFLDHKIKCGNGLVGAWFDTFQHYPVMAWKNREGGDKNHSNGVHFEKEARTKAIKAFVRDTLTPDLRTFLSGRNLFSEDLQLKAANVHAEALETLSRLHELPIQDSAERARIYREELVGSETYRSLRRAMDLWCACWFWPADDLDQAPLPTALTDPAAETLRVLKDITAKKRFFHWELEFPDVFRAASSGFDAILGNPPWDIAKPNSKEFFSNIDPLYRSYGKQEAIGYQSEYFSEEELERSWLDYNADFRAQSNYMGYAPSAFGDPAENESSQDRFTVARGRDNDLMHGRWRAARANSRGFADPRHPFRHQGSADINLYKAFLEQAHALLQPGGRLGFIVPSGIYTDHGTGGLRKLFLDRCRWEWLFGFENRDGIFEIHRSYKFNPIIIEKGGKTESIKTSFMRRKLEDWEQAEILATPYTRAQVDHFSPRSKAILEIQSRSDLEALEKIYANSVLLGEDGPNGWGISYAREFDMTNDSKLFPPRPRWEGDGYWPDEYSRWLKGDWRPIDELWAELGVKPLPEGEHHCAQPPYDRLPIPRINIPAGVVLSRNADAWISENQIGSETVIMKDSNGNREEVNCRAVALPLYQGKMIWQFDYSRSYATGLAGSLDWADTHPSHKIVQSKYLMGEWYAPASWFQGRTRIAFRDVQNATNQRTFIGTIIPGFPAGNTVPVISTGNFLGAGSDIAILSALCSFPLDRILRGKMSQNHVNWFYAAELPIPKALSGAPGIFISQNSIRFVSGVLFAPSFCRWSLNTNKYAWRSLWALLEHERLRLRCIIDAIVASLYGLNIDNMKTILDSCDYPSPYYSRASIVASLDPKGFWRVDRDKDPELRHTVLTLIAFYDLEEKIRACGGDREKGIEAFLNQNDGEGWMIPETLCLADYGLGHDDRAKEHQPVASRLGPRFYDWQLAQSPEESWRECHLHARNLLGEEGYKHLLAEIGAEKRGETIITNSESSSGGPEKALEESQQVLFD